MMAASKRAGSLRPNGERVAVYPGSFDPLTNGHVDIILRGSRIFDRIVVAILENVEKTPLFGLEERIEIARDVFKKQPNVEVDEFGGLLVDYVEQRGANVNARNKMSSATPLMMAAQRGRAEFARFLIEKGADPLLQDDRDMYAHQFARDSTLKGKNIVCFFIGLY